MTIFLKKYSIFISIMLIVVLIICAWLFPSIGIIFASTFLLFGLVVITYSIVEKHKKAYFRGEIAKLIYIRNITLEIIIVLLAMLLAALLGDYIAHYATRQIANNLARFAVGVVIGLIVGIGVGMFIKRTWEKIQQISIKWHHNRNVI